MSKKQIKHKRKKPNRELEKYSEDFLNKADGRLKFVRKMEHRLKQLTDDIGGIKNISYQKLCICKRVVFIEAQIDQMEEQIVNGIFIESNRYNNAVNVLTGLLRTIGLERKTRQVDLNEYLKGK